MNTITQHQLAGEIECYFIENFAASTEDNAEFIFNLLRSKADSLDGLFTFRAISLMFADLLSQEKISPDKAAEILYPLCDRCLFQQ